jgi:signal transduction histidine kinase
VHLSVHDGGVGFDLEKVLGGHGLGLISMRERVRFVNGEISIQSTPNGGTTIEVVVPLPADTVKAESA